MEWNMNRKKKFGIIAAAVALIATVALAAGYERIPKDLLILGSGSSATKTIEFDVGLGAANPKMRGNSATPSLEFASDGTSFLPFGSGGGGASGINTVVNGDFELGTANNWTASGGTFADETGGNLLNGSKSASWDPTTTSQTLTSDEQDLPLVVDDKVCLASFFYKGGDANYRLEVLEGGVSVIATKNLIAVTEATNVVVPFLCPTGDTLSLRFITTADAAVIYLDDIFLGTRDRVRNSLELISVRDPNGTLSGGGVSLTDGRVLKTYDGSGTLGSDYGKKLTINFDTILGGNPANATKYSLCIDKETLGAAVTTTDTKEKIVGLVQANFVLLTTAPEDTFAPRYLCLAYITSATTGNLWFGEGSSFDDYPRNNGQSLVSVNPITYSASQSVGSVGSVANAQGPLVDGDFPTPASVAYYHLDGDANADGQVAVNLTENGAPTKQGAGFFGRESLLQFRGAQFLSTNNAHFNPGDASFAWGGWVKANWLATDTQSFFVNEGSASDRGIIVRKTNATITFLSTNTAGGYDHSIDVQHGWVDTGWHHIAVVFDKAGGKAKLYLDGQLSAEIAKTNQRSVTISNFQIGMRDSVTEPALNLDIQDAFFTKSLLLTDAQINAIYSKRFSNNQQLAGGHVLTDDSFPLTSLTGKAYYYNLTANSNDASGNGLNLTNSGVVFTDKGIFGNGTSALYTGTNRLSSTSAVFNPGNKNFTTGLWVKLNEQGDGFILSQYGGASQFSYAILIAASAKTIIFRGSTDGTALGQCTIPQTVQGTWQHLTFRYTAGSNTIDGFRNGVKECSIELASGLYTAGGTPTFRVSTLDGSSDPTNMANEQLFFVSDLLSDNDIRKLASARLDHNVSTPTNFQEWFGNYTREDAKVKNQLAADWLVDKTATSAYVDFGLPAGDNLEVKLRDTGFSPERISTAFYNTGELSADPSFPVSHGLPGRPLEMAVWTEGQTLSGQWDKREDLCSATSTQITCDLSSLTIGPSNKVQIVAGMTPGETSIRCATPTSNGLLCNNSAVSIKGTSTNDNAVAGAVGEIITDSLTVGSSVVLTTGVPATIVTLNIPSAGHWKISGVMNFSYGASASVAETRIGTSLTAATLPAASTYGLPTNGEMQLADSFATNVVGGQRSRAMVIPSYTYKTTGPQTLYFVASSIFTVASGAANGYIEAERVR